MYSKIIHALVSGLFALLTVEVVSAEERTVPFEGANWRTDSEQTAEVRDFLGRKALFVERAMVWRDKTSFGDGVIEYDVAAPVPSGFVGINFRVLDENNFEQFYVRFHQSGHQDATQYLPVYKGLTSWQLHAGPNETAIATLPARQWIHVKIVTKDDQADIYVGDADKPLIHINDLYRDYASGPVALYAADRPEMTSGAYFSNINIRPLQAGDEIIGTHAKEASLPEGVIKKWHISKEFPESDFTKSHDIKDKNLQSLNWTDLTVERNGIANLAKVSQVASNANTVLVRTTISAEQATDRLFHFGYSDRVRLYLNGKQVFFGNAGWRVRDHRFLGTVGLHDAIVLELKPGENELVAAVSESFGGWGFTGQIENQSDLTVR